MLAHFVHGPFWSTPLIKVNKVTTPTQPRLKTQALLSQENIGGALGRAFVPGAGPQLLLAIRLSSGKSFGRPSTSPLCSAGKGFWTEARIYSLPWALSGQYNTSGKGNVKLIKS